MKRCNHCGHGANRHTSVGCIEYVMKFEIGEGHVCRCKLTEEAVNSVMRLKWCDIEGGQDVKTGDTIRIEKKDGKIIVRKIEPVVGERGTEFSNDVSSGIAGREIVSYSPRSMDFKSDEGCGWTPEKELDSRCTTFTNEHGQKFVTAERGNAFKQNRYDEYALEKGAQIYYYPTKWRQAKELAGCRDNGTFWQEIAEQALYNFYELGGGGIKVKADVPPVEKPAGLTFAGVSWDDPKSTVNSKSPWVGGSPTEPEKLENGEFTQPLLKALDEAGIAPGSLAERRTAFRRIGDEVGELVEEKNAAYGDAFAKCGAILQVLYPTGIKPEQYIDALATVRILDKLFRIATRKDAFSESPYRDIAGYGILGAANDENKK